MIVAGEYSFNSGKEIIEKQYASELQEIMAVITSINSHEHKTKVSKEITMPGKILYSPPSLNRAFKQVFAAKDWDSHRVLCEYPTEFYTSDYQPPQRTGGSRPYREMDYVKNRVGIEVQFGKYAFMVYNVAAKMTIFHNMSIIDVGVEIVPIKEFANEMSTGVSYFEQFVWDLEQRGISDIDIPVLILGIMSDPNNEHESSG
jgi:hypothetical protein